MWNKIQDKLRNMMVGRNGMDNMGVGLLAAIIALSILNLFFRTGILSLIGNALCIWALFRIFSHNLTARQEENRRFTQGYAKWRTEGSQALERVKNARQYKYFRCPECHERLRMPRHIGEKTVTCSHCRHQFKQKA